MVRLSVGDGRGQSPPRERAARKSRARPAISGASSFEGEVAGVEEVRLRVVQVAA
jgi:hypothetical protein